MCLGAVAFFLLLTAALLDIHRAHFISAFRSLDDAGLLEKHINWTSPDPVLQSLALLLCFISP